METIINIMEINKELYSKDPSRYAVYQMLEHFGKNLIQKKVSNIYLFKTNPFIDTLYNYAHIFEKNLTKENLSKIEEFYNNSEFRIKVYENPELEKFLIENNYKFKDTGHVMIAKNLKKSNYEISFPKDIKILPVDDEKILKDYKKIFSEAFNCSIKETNRKFGFQDRAITDLENNHVNAFVLYEKKTPVSIGAYYAFEKFSIENIGTLKKYRGKGHAFKIMNHLLQEAKNLRYNEACLVASEAGSHVYKKVGFKTIAKTNSFTP